MWKEEYTDVSVAIGNPKVREYGEVWDEIGGDLVYLMNKQGRYESGFEDVNFNNIVLMFDYERQDPKFSEEKLCRLQSYFSDSTDEGNCF